MQRSQWTEHFEKVDRALRQILQPGPIRPTNELRSPAQREFRSRVRGRRLTVLVFVLTILIYFLCAPAGMLGAVFLTLKVAARIYPAAHAQPALVAFMVLDSIYVVLLGRVLWIASLVLWLVLCFVAGPDWDRNLTQEHEGGHTGSTCSWVVVVGCLRHSSSAHSFSLAGWRAGPPFHQTN